MTDTSAPSTVVTDLEVRQVPGGSGGNVLTWTNPPRVFAVGVCRSRNGVITQIAALGYPQSVPQTWTDKAGLITDVYDITCLIAEPASESASAAPKPAPLAAGVVPALILTIGQPMSPLTLTATGGSGEYSWEAISDDDAGLPIGIACSGAGVVAGTPSANPPTDTTDQNTVVFKVTDSAGNVAQTVPVVWTLVDPATTTPTPNVAAGVLPSDAGAVPTTLAKYFDFVAAGAMGELPAGLAEGWYGNPTATQNDTPMTPANVIPTAAGLKLLVTSDGHGGLVSSYPAYTWEVTKPTYVEFDYIPATDPATGETVDWCELWATTQFVWEGEDDVVESLQPGTDTEASHVHDGENAVAPSGLSFQVTPGVVNKTGILHLPNGVRYVVHNGKFIGQMQGLSDAAMTAALKGEGKWFLVVGNSHMPGTPLVPSTLVVKAAGVWQ